MKKTNKNLTSFADHLDSEYGIRGTETHEKYEEGFEAFKMNIIKHYNGLNSYFIQTRGLQKVTNWVYFLY